MASLNMSLSLTDWLWSDIVILQGRSGSPGLVGLMGYPGLDGPPGLTGLPGLPGKQGRQVCNDLVRQTEICLNARVHIWKFPTWFCRWHSGLYWKDLRSLSSRTLIFTLWGPCSHRVVSFQPPHSCTLMGGLNIGQKFSIKGWDFTTAAPGLNLAQCVWCISLFPLAFFNHYCHCQKYMKAKVPKYPLKKEEERDMWWR